MLSGGCLGLGLTDIRESKSTNEAPSPRNDAGFVVSSAVFVAMSPLNRKKTLLGKNLLELVLLKQGKSTNEPCFDFFFYILYTTLLSLESVRFIYNKDNNIFNQQRC